MSQDPNNTQQVRTMVPTRRKRTGDLARNGVTLVLLFRERIETTRSTNQSVRRTSDLPRARRDRNRTTLHQSQHQVGPVRQEQALAATTTLTTRTEKDCGPACLVGGLLGDCRNESLPQTEQDNKTHHHLQQDKRRILCKEQLLFQTSPTPALLARGNWA